MTREIVLTQGKVALVDDQDYERLSQWHWRVVAGQRYAGRSESVPGTRKHKTVYMHRVILNAPADVQVDHINGNRLDNRRANLRQCTHAENIRNQKSHRGSSSRFKGVSLMQSGTRWRVNICVDGKNQHLGTFTDEADAARAYDAKARELHGAFARCNFEEPQS